MYMWHKFLLLTAACGLCLSLCAQSAKSSNKKPYTDVFETLSKTPAGGGKVVIKQDPKMKSLMRKKLALNDEKAYVTFSGYRVQVYMGNLPKKSKVEAMEREKKIKAKYPDVTSYLTFSSPFWKLRLGDFRVQTEAMVFAQNILSEFPEMTGEVFVVDDIARDVRLEK